MGKLVISKTNSGSLFWRVFLMIEPSVRADATVVCLLARHAGRLPLLVFALQYKHHCCLIQICVTVKYWCAILVCNTCATSCFCPSFTSPVTCSQLTSISAWKPLVTTPDNCCCVCYYATVQCTLTSVHLYYWLNMYILCTRLHTSVPLSERAEGCFWQPCHAVFLKETKIRHFRQREKLFPFEQKSSLPSRRNIGGILLLGILQSLNRSI